MNTVSLGNIPPQDPEKSKVEFKEFISEYFVEGDDKSVSLDSLIKFRKEYLISISQYLLPHLKLEGKKAILVSLKHSEAFQSLQRPQEMERMVDKNLKSLRVY